MKHLLKLLDCTPEEITSILDLADQLKYERKHHISHRLLEGKSIGLIFQKSSTRTRVSFETGMFQLGGQALFLSSRDLQIGRGEPVQDTARVLSRYLDGIMIRTYEQKEVEDLAKYGSIPIINGLTDFCHPCQVLADLMTIREKYGVLKGLKMCYIGDGNNMANSLIVGGLKSDMQVSIATPDNYRPAKEVLDFAAGNDAFTLVNDPIKAVENADVVITDTWTSMGQEEEKKIRQQEKDAAEKAARDYEAKKNPVPESEVKKPLSGDPERPYCRGRAYDPSHYGRKRAAESDAEQTKE